MHTHARIRTYTFDSYHIEIYELYSSYTYDNCTIPT